MHLPQLNTETVQQFLNYAGERHQLFQSEALDLLLACWQPGYASLSHTHGEHDGIMIVLEGEITETQYHSNGYASVQWYQAGDVVRTPAGLPHHVVNSGTTPTVCLHFLTPPTTPEQQALELGYSDTHSPHLPSREDRIRYMMGITDNKLSFYLLP